jgi:hypothetical protein
VEDIFVNAELVRKGCACVYPKGLFPEMEHYDLLRMFNNCRDRSLDLSEEADRPEGLSLQGIHY